MNVEYFDEFLLDTLMTYHGYPRKRKIDIYRNVFLNNIKDWLPLSLRRRVIRRLIGKFGNSLVAPQVTFDPVYPEYIEIGDNVIIGMQTLLVTHMITPATKNIIKKLDNNDLIETMTLTGCKKEMNANGLIERCKYLIVTGKIIIEDDVFIGGRVTIRPGTRLRSGVVIASDSLVYGDLEPGVYAGIPAKKIRDV